MSPDTWMPLFVGRYLHDTSQLTTAQHGAYLLLLMHYWMHGPLEDDDEALAAIARVDGKTWRKQFATRLRKFFQCRDGMLFQKRMEIERARAADISSKRRAAAIASHNRPPPPGSGNGADHPKSNGADGLHLQAQMPVDKPAIAGASASANAPPNAAFSAANAVVHSTLNQESKNTFLGEESRASARETTSAPAADAVGPDAVQAVVSAVQKAQRMKAYPPRAAVRDRNQQLDELEENGPVELRRGPVDPVRTVEEQLAWLREHAA